MIQFGALEYSHPMVCVEFAEVVGRCRRRHPLKNTRRGLNERNLDAKAGGDCGGFESDVAWPLRPGAS